MRLVIVLGFLACGPGLKQPAPKDLAIRWDDAPAIARMLSGSVVNGGLWFSDANCAAKFGLGGNVPPDEFPDYARCLTTLRLQNSARSDALGDVVVLTYAPGFEVEARIVQMNGRARLAWIGFSAKRATDSSPTITHDALETLRTAGIRHGLLPPAIAPTLTPDAAPDKRESAWLKLCLDESGAITERQVYMATSVEASKAFVAATSEWAFRPFQVDGNPMPACAMVRMTYPPAPADDDETLPLPPPPPSRNGKVPIVLSAGALRMAKRVSGAIFIAPDDKTKMEMTDGRHFASFRLCLDDTGHVESVLPIRLTGYTDYDRKLVGGMQQWVYEPFIVDGQPMPVCTGINFIYSQR